MVILGQILEFVKFSKNKNKNSLKNYKNKIITVFISIYLNIKNIIRNNTKFELCFFSKKWI